MPAVPQRFDVRVARPAVAARVVVSALTWLVAIALLLSCWPALFFAKGVFGWTRKWTSNRRTMKRGKAATVELSGDTITVGNARYKREEIVGGWIEPLDFGQIIVLRLTRGRRVLIEARTMKQARALLRAFGVDVDRQAVRLPLASGAVDKGHGPPYHVLVPYFLFTLFYGFGLQIVGQYGANPLWGVFIAALGTFGVFHFIRSIIPGHVVIGRDGFTVRRPGVNRYVPFREIRHIDRREHGVVVFTGDDYVVLNTNHIGGQDPELASSVEQRINDALHDYQGSPEAEEMYLRLLERDGRELDDWRTALVGVVGEGGGYRAARISPEQLLEIVEDARASAEHRLGAAIAIAGSDRKSEASPRLRIAATTCAHQPLRVALEAVLEDELAEADAEAALEAQA